MTRTRCRPASVLRVSSSSPCPSNGDTATENKSATAASAVFIVQGPSFLDSAPNRRSFPKEFVDPGKQVVVLLLVGFNLDLLGPKDKSSLEWIQMFGVTLAPNKLRNVGHHILRGRHVLRLVNTIPEASENDIHRRASV